MCLQTPRGTLNAGHALLSAFALKGVVLGLLAHVFESSFDLSRGPHISDLQINLTTQQ